MRTLNLGILAHVDAGKTTLTERLLHTAGVIDELGSVDDGSTTTDSLALERARGITIRSAVVSFPLRGTTVNLVDTPGHPDFVAEVERVLDVLDGVVLVVSAVEGVQPQTRVLMRTLQRLRLPTLVFVNKADRRGADERRVLAALRDRLSPGCVPLGTLTGAGTRETAYAPYDGDDPAHQARLAEVLGEHDDTVLTAYVEGRLDPAVLRHALRRQTGRAVVHPVLLGSAATGAGVDALVDAVTSLLPASAGDEAAALSARVLAVERGPAGERLAVVRVHAGVLRSRSVLAGTPGKVTGLGLHADGHVVPADAVPAGRVGVVRGLPGVRVGDSLGVPRPPLAHQFALPTLETVVTPVHAADAGRLHTGLTELAERDPLIGFRLAGEDAVPTVSLYGEVQKEVLAALLRDEHDVPVSFSPTVPVRLDRVVSSAAAHEVIAEGDHGFLATVGLRVDPAAPGSGESFALAVELGSMPPAFFTAVRESVTATLAQGVRGRRVVDCTVTMTHSGYWARQSHAHGTFDKSSSSTAGDFRGLTRLVLRAVLGRVGLQVLEPVHRFRLELPTDALGAVLPVLAALEAVPEPEGPLGASSYVVTGTVPAARLHELQQRLPTLTGGEGVLETEPADHRPARPVSR